MTEQERTVTETIVKQPWWDIFPGDPQTAGDTAARFAAMAVAHSASYQPWLVECAHEGNEEHDGCRRDEVRRQTHAHLMPYLAAFTAAALAKGWTAEKVNDRLANDPQVCDELAWQWVSEAGGNPDAIAPAGDPVTTGIGLTSEQWDPLRGKV